MKKIDIVLGLHFGDEGKGNITNSLATSESLVVRFNGGHQAGHTVTTKRKKHVFSSFGSGTFKGAATYITEFCTVYPTAFMNELKELGTDAEVYIDAAAMVTTPYDIYKNIEDAVNIKHGSVGVGFGTTIARNEANFHLYVRDLLIPTIRDAKLELMKNHYFNTDTKPDLEVFKKACDAMVDKTTIVDNFQIITSKYEHIIFEGAQGILLDMDHGFFPNVTRSNTTMKNAMTLINNHINDDVEDIHIYYVTRSYLTRHGAGFLPNEKETLDFINVNPDETNVSNTYQGKLRYAPLNIDLLYYAIKSNNLYATRPVQEHLVITCMDQLKDPNFITVANSNGDLVTLTKEDFKIVTNLHYIYTPKLVNFADSIKI